MNSRFAADRTVTFLFTDIEGSTRLWEAVPDQMQVALRQHDQLLSAIAADHQGHVFKTVGDAFCIAFETVTAALTAAAQIQAALRDLQWPPDAPLNVRMAVHTGAVEHRDNDYFGPTLNRVARLLAIGSGGQILVSQASGQLARDPLPREYQLVDLGIHQLKDLGRPEQIFQLYHADLPQDFPELKSLSNRFLRHNLPPQLTTFVGRAEQINEATMYLRSGRLVTLTGAGGSGKTRLALQVAADLLEDFPDGVWLCELAPLSDPHLVAPAVSAVLGLKDEPGVSALESLTTFLRDQNVLLILDNCEHLLDATATLAEAVLRKAPKAKILATSREAMGVTGERSFRIPSLSLPAKLSQSSIAEVALCESVQLFVDRADLHRPGFVVNEENADALVSICQRLDGIPLALELAAARVRTLSPEEIDARLDQRFRLLTGGSRTALPRQQTLRSLIDWSYALLTPEEKQLLCRLSVFSGGWKLESAEAIFTEDDVLSLLESLFDKSLVVFEESPSGGRYRLLETVRQYARDRLMEEGDGVSWRDRHARHFLAYAESANLGLRGPHQRECLEKIESEQDNIRTALEWLLQDADVQLPLRLCAACCRFWVMRGRYAEGRDWSKRALDLPGAEVPTDTRATLINGYGIMVYDQGELLEAKELYLESIAIREKLNDRAGMVNSMINLGNTAWSLSDFDLAEEWYTKTLAIARETKNRWTEATALNNLGSLSTRRGNFRESLPLYEESLAIRRELGEYQHIALSLSNIADALVHLGDLARARDLLNESLTMRLEVQDVRGLIESLETSTALAVELGEGQPAAQLDAAVQKLRVDYHCPEPPSEIVRTTAIRNRIPALVGSDEEYQILTQRGTSLTLHQAVALAQMVGLGPSSPSKIP